MHEGWRQRFAIQISLVPSSPYSQLALLVHSPLQRLGGAGGGSEGGEVGVAVGAGLRVGDGVIVGVMSGGGVMVIVGLGVMVGITGVVGVGVGSVKLPESVQLIVPLTDQEN